MNVYVSVRARLHVAKAAIWYENQSPGLGGRFEQAILETYSRIQRLPAMFAEVAPGIRAALLKTFPYRVLYVVADESVIVTGVYHTSRHPRAWRGDE